MNMLSVKQPTSAVDPPENGPAFIPNQRLDNDLSKVLILAN